MKNTKRSLAFVFPCLLIVLSVPCLAQKKTMYSIHQKSDRKFGYELIASVQNYRIKSNISQLSGLALRNEGALLGVRWSTNTVALRSHAGFFYSSPDVCFSFDEFDIDFGLNLYLNELFNIQMGAFHPYINGILIYQHERFYGTYIGNHIVNYSLGEDPLLGKLNWVQASLGFGMEYRLDTEPGKFLSVFLAGKYGVPFLFKSSNEHFSQTEISSAATLLVGVAFGISSN